MRHARRNLQRIARLAAVGGLVCGGLLVSNAVAGEAPAGQPEADHALPAAELGADLLSRLGTSRTAGSWMADDGQPVVAVTDKSAAKEVREAGARAKVVSHSMRELRSATEALREAPRVPGTAWSVDYGSNQVMVHADSTVSSGDWSRMTSLAERLGGSVRMERTEGTFTTRLNGADPIFTPGGRCSAGFNVTNGQEDFILTAGHCGPVGTRWFQDSQGGEPVGNTVAGEFPGSDFSLVEYEKGASESASLDGDQLVDIGGGQGVRITGAADPAVGQKVYRSGSTTGFHSGEVTALNATVNYPEGTVTGLIETSVCAERGDSGGPLFSDGLALGVTSGGNGDCANGGVTFFQPVSGALESLGVRLAGNAGDASGSGDAEANAPAPAAGAGTPGASGGSTAVTELVSLRALAPGVAVIAVSLLALAAAGWVRSGQGHGRRRYQGSYSQGWG